MWVDAGNGYFMLGHFVAGHIKTVHGQNVSGQNPGGQNASQNCKGGGDKMLAILRDKEGKMPILSKHLIYDSDGQVN